MSSLLMPVVPEEHRETFFQIIIPSIPGEKLDALREVMGEDLFFLLSTLAGSKVHYPKMTSLQLNATRAAAFDMVAVRVADGMNEDEAMDEVALELGIHKHKVAQAFRMVRDILKQVQMAAA